VVAAKISRASAAAIQIKGRLLLQVQAQGHHPGIREEWMHFKRWDRNLAIPADGSVSDTPGGLL
jgi:hypothetical protein